MHFYLYIFPIEDLIACLKSPLQRRYQDNIDILISQQFPSCTALLLPLFSDAAIDEFLGICETLVEIFKLGALVP
jgi:hypothetical protein